MVATRGGQMDRMKMQKAAMFANKLSFYFGFPGPSAATTETHSYEQHFITLFIEEYGILKFF
jgi:hypothetical protein